MPEQWIVGVRDNRRPCRERTGGVPKEPSDDLRLGEPVKLIAEHVGQDEDLRLYRADNTRERRFIDFEHRAVFITGGGRERGRDATEEVRTTRVRDDAHAGSLQDHREHRRRRRLAVGSGDHSGRV